MQRKYKNPKVICTIFPESYALDACFSKKKLDEWGYSHTKLDSPVLYRGDTRSPTIIFKTGFYRRLEKKDYFFPYITKRHESKHCIATSKDLVHAIGFADCPVDTQGEFFEGEKKEHSWVYVFYAEKGVDLTLDPQGRFTEKPHKNMAVTVKEVAFTGIPPEHIIAALKIKTTKNEISDYCGKDYCKPRIDDDRSWQILVTDFKINDDCILRDTNPALFVKMCKEFSAIHQTGYYRIPWALTPEEKDFPLTHSLTKEQKAALSKYKLTVDQAQKLKNESQIQGLEVGFTIEDVIASWFDSFHVSAVQLGAPVDVLRGTTYIEAYGLEKKFSYDQVKGLTSIRQITGLQVGFTREDVLSDWFSWRHTDAADDGIAVDTLRGLTRFEVYGLIKGLSIEQARGVDTEFKVEALVAGFSRNDLGQLWLQQQHVWAAGVGISVDLLRGKTEIEVYGLRNKLDYSQVKGLQTMTQVDGLLLGFTLEDVKSEWYGYDVFLRAKMGISIESLRPASQVKSNLFGW